MMTRAFVTKISLVVLLMATAVSSAGLADAQARPEVKIPVLISPVNSGPYIAWAIVQERAREWHPWIRPIAVETPGFVYNITYTARSPQLWKTNLYGSGTVAEWAAGVPFKPYFPDKVPAEDKKIVGVMAETANIFVTLDPTIKTPADFKGKRVGVGLRTQNEWGMHGSMILETLGIRKTMATLDNLGDQQNIEALLDGRTDVGLLVVFFDPDQNNFLFAPPHRHLEASGRKFYYVSTPPDMIEEFNKKTGARFHTIRLAAGKMPNQPEPVTTFGNLLTIMAHKDFPEELAYEFTKFWVDMAPKLAKLHGFGKPWSLRTLSYTAKENPGAFHLGALRAYRELGALK
ncbi:MAG: TAXI family TRAP transporter solute-binding subunit [bacterium]